ncbi:hypothetical protein M6B38_207750 [Iris pallida]|uniref:Secreted protein n=1 Tax=Iris pallida TaxID=29817 RepID=A0AAX6E5T1_IRIPA|nr:hypothetical protein M6B38_207750 [Iris pallida]
MSCTSGSWFTFLYFISCTLHSCTFMFFPVIYSSCSPVLILMSCSCSLPRTALCSAPDWICCRCTCRISFYHMGQSPGH